MSALPGKPWADDGVLVTLQDHLAAERGVEERLLQSDDAAADQHETLIVLRKQIVKLEAAIEARTEDLRGVAVARGWGPESDDPA